MYDRERKLLCDMHAVMTTPTDGKDGYNGGQRPFLSRFESAPDKPASRSTAWGTFYGRRAQSRWLALS